MLHELGTGTGCISSKSGEVNNNERSKCSNE
jgi:hypothetical protein